MGNMEMTDGVLQAEIELLSDVVADMAGHTGPLTPDEIDSVLGVAAS